MSLFKRVEYYNWNIDDIGNSGFDCRDGGKFREVVEGRLWRFSNFWM